MDSLMNGLKVMVVDDSNTIRKTAEALLGKAGFTVITATDGFDSLARVVRHRPDIIFIDIMMPRLDGYQTCTLIKGNAEFRHIPVILLSSKDGLFDRARGRSAGANDYLTKPFSRDDLLTAIARHAGPGSTPGATADVDNSFPTRDGVSTGRTPEGAQ